MLTEFKNISQLNMKLELEPRGHDIRGSRQIPWFHLIISANVLGTDNFIDDSRYHHFLFGSIYVAKNKIEATWKLQSGFERSCKIPKGMSGSFLLGMPVKTRDYLIHKISSLVAPGRVDMFRGRYVYQFCKEIHDLATIHNIMSS